MRIQVNKHTVEGHGVLERTNFTIASSYQAFSLLGDKLYSDKIGSIIRELSSNALDAHKFVGKENIPFKIKLPTMLDSTFSIRDYGPGLSHEDIKNIYTRYFESTKDESNDFIGAFGLGSKTPFAYTNMFTVVSRHKGIRRIYSAYMDNAGPGISLLSESETDEPDGLEVSFNVEQKDFRTFEQKLVKQLKHFRVKPEVISDNEIEWPTFTKKYEGKNWFAVENDRYYRSNFGLYALISDIEYSINVGQLGLTDSEDDELEQLNRDLNLATRIDLAHYLKFEIGELNVSVSREELSYDKYTVSNLIKRLKQYIAELREAVANDFKVTKKYDNQWDAMCAAGSLISKNNSYKIEKIYEFLGGTPEFLYKGMPVKPWVNLVTPTYGKNIDNIPWRGYKAPSEQAVLFYRNFGLLVGYADPTDIRHYQDGFTYVGCGEAYSCH